MNKVRNKATVAQKTVTAVSKGQVKRPRKSPRPVANRNGKIKVIKVHKAVWRKAMELAGGNRHRLEVRDATTVVVHNPNWKG